MMKTFLILVVLICFTASGSFAQKKRPKRESQNDKLITALIKAKDVRGVWGDDAMYIFTGASEMEAIFALGKNAIPLLIAHLDDKRLTGVATSSATFARTEEFTVTIGAACFDLLNYIVRKDPRFFDRDCLKDLDEQGEGHTSSCANKKYAVSPEDFWSGRIEVDKDLWHGKTLIVPKNVRRAKRNWQTAYRKRWIHYKNFDG